MKKLEVYENGVIDINTNRLRERMVRFHDRPFVHLEVWSFTEAEIMKKLGKFLHSVTIKEDPRSKGRKP